MAPVVQAYKAVIAFDGQRPAAPTMSHPQGFIEKHARSERGGGALQPATIFDADKTLIADALFGRKEDEGHAQRI